MWALWLGSLFSSFAAEHILNCEARFAQVVPAQIIRKVGQFADFPLYGISQVDYSSVWSKLLHPSNATKAKDNWREFVLPEQTVQVLTNYYTYPAEKFQIGMKCENGQCTPTCQSMAFQMQPWNLMQDPEIKATATLRCGLRNGMITTLALTSQAAKAENVRLFSQASLQEITGSEVSMKQGVHVDVESRKLAYSYGAEESLFDLELIEFKWTCQPPAPVTAATP